MTTRAEIFFWTAILVSNTLGAVILVGFIFCTARVASRSARAPAA